MKLSAKDLRSRWRLDPSVAFLNHGSFGACPRDVLAEQQALRERMEAEPMRFFIHDLELLLETARDELAAFVHADSDDLVFVPNATTGVNTVLRSLDFSPSDELLTTDHAYNACSNALRFAAERAGSQLVVARVPFPLASPDEVVAAVLERVTPRTRLALIDHVTSPTGMVWPVELLVRALEARGVDTLVDGAHAPGMIPLDLGALGAAYYAANCHKWLCAPKGAGFLLVRADRKQRIRPLVISHGANTSRKDRHRFRLEFDWTGTIDPTPYLCVPVAIRWLGALDPGGWPAVMEHNRELALAARRVLARALAVALPCPEEMIGALAALPLPDGSSEPPRTLLYADPLQKRCSSGHASRCRWRPGPSRPSG